MPDAVISLEGIGKKYVIGHEAQREPYTALRDVIARTTKTFLRKAGDTIRGRPVIEGDKLEEFWALRDVSFEIKRGEVVGVIGRNGAGKSTLLRILSRITEPSEGRACITGRVASLLEVGTGFHPELTGKQNIFLNGAILGMAKAEVKNKFDEIVAFAEVERFLDTPVKRFSSGMYVRLAFAVAAHLEPEILIIDEVLAVGDVEFQKKCLGKMGDVASQGRTVLFVSHNMTAVRSLCSRALLLEEGRTAAEGEVDQVVNRYLSRGEKAHALTEWSDPAKAPGDQCVRLKSIHVSCDSMEPGSVDIQKEFTVHIEYWVMEEGVRVTVATLLCNARGEVVITSSNLSSTSATFDPWVEQPYPVGVYRSSCSYPGRLLNDGIYALTVYINDNSIGRSRVFEQDILKFEIIDTGYMREEFHGNWMGILRMKLPWSTEPVRFVESSGAGSRTA
jgi:lipopolysaccharide transport system ATP-binding protein